MDLRQTQRIDQILATANRLRKRHPRFFEYQKGQEVKKLPMQEILYFQSENRQVHIITKRQEDVFYGTLSQVEKQLDQEEFLWIHKSILVNQQHISKYQYDQITLENGVILPISQAKRKEIRRMRLEKEQWEN